MTLIQDTPAWQLTARVENTRFGYHLEIRSFVPGARRPETQLQFSGIFSSEELLAFRGAIDEALALNSSVQSTSSSVEAQ